MLYGLWVNSTVAIFILSVNVDLAVLLFARDINYRFVMLYSPLTCFVLCSIKAWCIAELAGPVVHTGTTYADTCFKTQFWKILFEDNTRD